MMARNLPNVPVLVGKNRYAAGRAAIDRFRVQALVLDDGFQHRRLYRDLDIVLMDRARPLGNGRLFPSGILRESPASLDRAGALVFTRCHESSPQKPARICAGKPPLVFHPPCPAPGPGIPRQGFGQDLDQIRPKRPAPCFCSPGWRTTPGFSIPLRNLGFR